MSESVRSRLEASTNNTNERIGRSADSDFTGLQSADGYVTIINKRVGRSFTWVAQCSKPGCFCSGITFSHEYLVAGNPVKCPASGHDSATIEPLGDARRTSDAGVQQRVREDVVLSPRQRAEQAASAAEVKQFEEENNEQSQR